jgi:hypothetical protein
LDVPIRQWVFKSRCEGFIEGLKGSRPTRVNERRLAWGSGRQDIQRRTGRHHLHARPRRHLGDRRRPLQSSASPPRLKADSGEGYRLRLHAGEHRCVSRWQHGAIGQHKFGRGDNVAVTLFNDMARRPQPLSRWLIRDHAFIPGWPGLISAGLAGRHAWSAPCRLFPNVKSQQKTLHCIAQWPASVIKPP